MSLPQIEEGGYQTIDLDNTTATPADDLEIVEESPTQPEVEQPVAKTPVAPVVADDEGDEPEGAEEEEQAGGPKRKLTRAQRLKAARDQYAAELARAQQEIAELRAKSAKYEKDAEDGAAIGLDLYIQTINDKMKALRADYDKAFDEGDRNKLFEVQTAMADLSAEKKLAERERRALPTRAAPSGREALPQTPQTTAQVPTSPPAGQPAGSNPLPAVAQQWTKENASWWGKDRVASMAAATISAHLESEGYALSDPEHFDKLDEMLRQEFPHKFGTKAAAADAPQRRGSTPTVQNRSTPAPSGKIRVIITAEDRQMAEHLGVAIEDYAREKAKRERAANTATQYTEIL